MEDNKNLNEQKFPQDENEYCAQKYVYLSDENNTLSVINNGTYGFSRIKNSMFVTLLRSAVYCAHPIDNRETLPRDRYVPHMEQGERYFELLITGGKREETEKNHWKVHMCLYVGWERYIF